MPLERWHLDQIFIRKLTQDRWNFIMNGRVEATKRAQERTMAGREAKKDFFYYLLNAKDPETGKGLSTPELWGEANVLMIAGSDTTSTTLAATLFYLVRSPETLAKLTKEVRSAFSTVEDIVKVRARKGAPIAGAVLGRALYAGTIQPAEALRAAA